MKNVIPFTARIEEKLEIGSRPEPILPPLLSVEEVCTYLGLGRTIVTEMLRKGEIPHTRARNRIRVYATDLRAYLDSRKIGNVIN